MTAETEANKALMRRWFEEVLNQRKFEVIDELTAEQFVMYHTMAPPQARISRARYREMLPDVFAALPDLRITLEVMIAEGDLVAMLLRATGTHQAALGDIPPSHKPVVQPTLVLFRCADGKFVEAWEGERAWAITLAEAAQA